MTDISELMTRDPMSLSDQDLDAIILRLRQGRAQYKLGAKSATSAKKTVGKKPAGTIDLEALGLVATTPAASIDLASLGLLPPAEGSKP